MILEIKQQGLAVRLSLNSTNYTLRIDYREYSEEMVFFIGTKKKQIIKHCNLNILRLTDSYPETHRIINQVAKTFSEILYKIDYEPEASLKASE